MTKGMRAVRKLHHEIAVCLEGAPRRPPVCAGGRAAGWARIAVCLRGAHPVVALRDGGQERQPL
jgi:hypothetical protein